MRNLDASTAYVGSTEISEVRLGEQLVLAPNGNELWYTANEVPSLDLRFAEDKSLVDATTGSNLVDFTRASSGTYVGSDGLIKTAVTNLLTYSEEFNQSGDWSALDGLNGFGSGSVANAETSPNGQVSADLITEDTSTGFHRIGQQFSYAANTVYMFSVYAKAGSRSKIHLHLSSGLFKIARFDLAAGTATGDGSIQPVGNGWYRCSLFSSNTSSGLATVYVEIADDSNQRQYTGDGSAGIYIWGAQVEQSDTVGEYVKTTSTINSAPRFDHDPTTGESLGLLVEEARTNSIRNNTMVGAVAGTPGTLPTNWSRSASPTNGISSEVIGSGTEAGIAYLDVRFTGTATSTFGFSVNTDTSTAAAANASQAWIASSYVKLAAGTLGNAYVQLLINEYSSVPAFLRNTFSAIISPTTASLLTQRSLVSATTGASTASVQCTFFVAFANGSTYDFTLRIGLPQLEQGAFATSVIPTEGSTVTRAADVATDTSTGANIRTLYAQFRSPASGTCPVASLDDNTANERIELLTSGTDPKLLVTDGGSAVADLDAGAVVAGTSAKLATRFATDDYAAVVNGGTIQTDTAGTLPTVDRLRVGSDQAGNYFSGTIARLTGWDIGLPDSTLQAMTG